MKKIENKIFVLFLLLGTAFLFSCASKGKVTSTASSQHVVVEQTTTGVYITLKKSSGENISKIELTDDAGSYASVPMEKNSVSFPWPFAEYNKKYTITAQIHSPKSTSKETVTFKVENDVPAAIIYTDDYLNSKISLNAAGNERRLKFYTSADKIKSVFGSSKVNSAVLTLNVFSGSRLLPQESVLVADWNVDIINLALLNSIIDGFDLVKNSAKFNSTPKKLNEALQKNQTYYAKATVSFVLDGSYPKGLEFCTKPFLTNDTVYTPLAEKDLPNVTVDQK